MAKSTKLTLVGSVVGLVLLVASVVLTKTNAFAVSNFVPVASCSDLQAVDDTAGSELLTIKLTQDIDCTGVDFEPLFKSAASPNGFKGVFDGQNHAISNLVIDRPGTERVGLFSHTVGASLKNLTLTSGMVTAGGAAGALAGSAYDTKLHNIHSAVDVTAPWYTVGGLVGDMTTVQDAVLDRLSSSGRVESSQYVGGLFGILTVSDGDTVLRQSHTSGIVEPTFTDGGGMIGFVSTYSTGVPAALTIEDSYSTSNVGSASQAIEVGGLVGYIVSSSKTYINRSYASGTIDGSNTVGGLVGGIYPFFDPESNVEINNSFATGQLLTTDVDSTGGILGRASLADHYPEINNSYYDQTNTGAAFCVGLDLIACTGIDTAVTPQYFKDNTASPPLDTWNFTTVWQKNANAYPTLRPAPLDDNDGIDESIEAAAPNGGDGNNDGIDDSTQQNVASYVNSVTGEYMTLVVPDDCDITTVTTRAESANAVADSGYSYPTGLMDFTIDCGTLGYQATIDQYYFGTVAQDYALRKYNPTSNAYFTVSGASMQPVTIGGQATLKVSYVATDGGDLDIDDVQNGIIVDPVGLGLQTAGVPNTGLGGKR